MDILRAEFGDESRWRDVLYVAINLPLAIIEFVVVLLAWALALSVVTTPIWYDAVRGVSLPDWLGLVSSHDPSVVIVRTIVGVVLLAVAASLSQLVIALHRAVVAGLLCTSESRELRRQVEALRKSRSAVLDVEASELHRIERDLHDGAQQRLVMLTIDLGLASERIDTDPAAAKQLILEGQEQARLALAEIRDLVRGIAPSILLDRGLVAGAGVHLGTRGRAHRPAHRPRAGRATAARDGAGGLLRRDRGARQRRQAQRRFTLRGAHAAARGRGSSSRSGTTAMAALAWSPEADWPASRAGSPAWTGRSRCPSPVGGPTLVRAEIPVVRAVAPARTAGAAAGSRTEVRQDGEHAAVVVLRVGQLELPEDVADVLLGGAFGDAEELGDPDVGPTLRHGREHLAFAWRERGQRIVGPVANHELGDDLGSRAVPPRATRRRASMNSRMSPTRSLRR